GASGGRILRERSERRCAAMGSSTVGYAVSTAPARSQSRRRGNSPFASSSACEIFTLRMDVLGEPLGRQLVAEPVLLRLAVHDRSGRGELVAHSKIVEKAGDLAV